MNAAVSVTAFSLKLMMAWAARRFDYSTCATERSLGLVSWVATAEATCQG